MNSVIRLYTLLIRFYPRAFRNELGDEMCAVFADAVTDAAKCGNCAVFALCARELRDLLMAILREQWRERIKMETRTNDAMRFENVSWRALLAATGPFLIVVVISLMNMFQLGGTTAPDWLGYIFLGILILPFLIGLLKGIPRWCLPYLGTLVSLASLIVSLTLSSVLWRSIRMSDPWIVRLIIPAGFPWLGLIALTVLFVIVTLVLPPLRPVYARIRQDWTLISFSLYGAMILALVLTFEDYPPGRWVYEIVCSLILAVGAWAHLRSPRMRQRALVLFASVTLAMTVATVGKALLIASPEWPFTGTHDWQGEAISTVIDGVWTLVVILLVPALTNLLPQSSRCSLPA